MRITVDCVFSTIKRDFFFSPGRESSLLSLLGFHFSVILDHFYIVYFNGVTCESILSCKTFIMSFGSIDVYILLYCIHVIMNIGI